MHNPQIPVSQPNSHKSRQIQDNIQVQLESFLPKSVFPFHQRFQLDCRIAKKHNTMNGL